MAALWGDFRVRSRQASSVVIEKINCYPSIKDHMVSPTILKSVHPQSIPIKDIN